MVASSTKARRSVSGAHWRREQARVARPGSASGSRGRQKATRSKHSRDLSETKRPYGRTRPDPDRGGTSLQPIRRGGVALAACTAAILWLTSGTAWASSTDGGGTVANKLTHGEIGLNLLWIVIGAVLVIFMQAGFALVETGFCRAKHAAHVVSTNFAIFGLGFVAFFICGYAFMFGGYKAPGLFGYNHALGGSLIGHGNWVFLWKGGWGLSGHAYDVAVMAFFLYMVAFMDTTATIPTGAMAERWKWNSFVIWGLFCGAIYYPLFGAWTWGGGWLAKLGVSAGLGHGYTDFAGSGVVHMMGGTAALAGAITLGPRIGKYGRDGKPRTLSAHHIPMAM